MRRTSVPFLSTYSVYIDYSSSMLYSIAPKHTAGASKCKLGLRRGFSPLGAVPKQKYLSFSQTACSTSLVISQEVSRYRDCEMEVIMR